MNTNKTNKEFTKYLTITDLSDYIDESGDERFFHWTGLEIKKDYIEVSVGSVVYKLSPKEFIETFGDEEMIADSANIVDFLDEFFETKERDYRLMVKVDMGE